MNETTRWAFIKGTNKRYMISDHGEVLSLIKNIIKKPRYQSGYLVVILQLENGAKKYVHIHRCVAEYFVPNDDPGFKKHPYHKDENLKNNHYSNLEWRRRRPWLEKVYSKPVAIVKPSGNDIMEFTSLNQAAKFLGVNHQTVNAWRHGYNNKQNLIQVLDI